MSRKIALIIGIGGQDGSYLSELLLTKGYVVHGVTRSHEDYRIYHLTPHENFYVHEADVSYSLTNLINHVKPNEIYYLISQSVDLISQSVDPDISFGQPAKYFSTNTIGVLEILETIKTLDRRIKFFHTSTRDVLRMKETTDHRFSPHAISNIGAHLLVQTYRNVHGLFAVNGILYEHESPRKNDKSMIKKICRGVVDVKEGIKECLHLDCEMHFFEDWGHAKDFAFAIWKMMQMKDPGDHVVRTGIQVPIFKVVEKAFETLGMNLVFKRSTGIDDSGVVRVKFATGSQKQHIREDRSAVLNWKPKTSLEDMIEEMVSIELMSNED